MCTSFWWKSARYFQSFVFVWLFCSPLRHNIGCAHDPSQHYFC
uniref:Uncharacterized protein n=1 Tax=Anguilla anguilla TaxID=7936 RepID=A0A0E9QQ92_ANGAN